MNPATMHYDYIAILDADVQSPDSGANFLSASVPLFIWFAVLVIINAIYIPLAEEPGLVKRFGEEYLTYRQNVPRWIPRLRSWLDEAGALQSRKEERP